MREPPPIIGKQHLRAPGAYVLLLRLDDTAGLLIGRLGAFDVERGWYAYIGSAMGGLGSRVARHLRGDGRKRWHIDHLTDRAIERCAYLLPSDRDIECELALEVRSLEGASEPIRGFGSSDCRCRSHLFLLEGRALQALREMMIERGAGTWPGPSDHDGLERPYPDSK